MRRSGGAWYVEVCRDLRLEKKRAREDGLCAHSSDSGATSFSIPVDVV